jgi:phosphatidate cytidylyltransferase
VLRHRLLFGPVLIAVVVGALWLDEVLDRTPTPRFLASLFGGRDTCPPGVAVFLLAVVVSPFAAFELARILRANGIGASTPLIWLASLFGLLVSCLVPTEMPTPRAVMIVATAATIVMMLALFNASRGKTVEGVVASCGGALLAFVYLGLMFGFFLAMRREHAAWVVLWVILVTKSSDIGAYFTGRAIGRHKLIPWLSPGKTWEGSVGGVALATALGAATAGLVPMPDGLPALAPWQGAIIGATLAVVGQIGDLVASLLKRDAGIKDSSSALPGFGGVLDVIDSPLLAAPAAYWLLIAFAGPGAQT